MDIDSARDEILLSMLDNVVFDGWTERSFKESLSMAGYEAIAGARAFPGGIPDLLDHFSAWADRMMVDTAEGRAEAFHRLRTAEKVTQAANCRFEILEPHKEAVRRSLAVLALPPASTRTMRSVYRTVDTIWRLAGDTATDFSFYTRRAALAGILTSATLYWLNDESPDGEDTRDFVARRVDRLDRIGRNVHRYGRFGGATEAPWRLAASLRERVLNRRMGKAPPP